MARRTPRQLLEQVKQANEAIAAAERECWYAQRAAEVACAQTQAMHQAKLTRLENEFRDRALALAIEAHRCPKDWRGYLSPTAVAAQETGLLLTWRLAAPQEVKTYSFLARWEQLLAKAKQSAPANACPA